MKSTPKRTPETLKEIVPAVIDAVDGAETPFGKRYGGEVFALNKTDLEALKNGEILALDGMGEYVVFLKREDDCGR